MHPGVITDRRQLKALRVPPARPFEDETGPPEPEQRARGGEPRDDLWLIPPPQAGRTYSAEEVASLAGVQLSTVRWWVSRGRRTPDGERVHLKTLEAPRGRITPQALCAFLSKVNGIEVRLHGGKA